MENTIHIVFGFDQNYVMPCGVTMLSVCLNTPGPVCFHAMLSEDVTEESKKQLEGIASSNGKQIVFYSPDTTQFNGLPEFIHITKSTYLRFLIPDLLPEDIHKALYIDVDLLAVKSLRPLWETELGPEQPSAMAFDTATLDGRVHGATGIPMSREYFNAGVMLMNLDCWRSQDIAKACLQSVQEHMYPYMDQDALNVVIGDKVKRLHLKYNAQIGLLKRPLDKSFIGVKDYEKEISEAKADPVIIHYSESFKPWHSNYKWPEEWLKYKALSPWKSTPLKRCTAADKYKVSLSGIKELDIEYVDSIALPLLTIASRLGQRHPKAFNLLRKTLWTYVKRKHLIKDI